MSGEKIKRLLGELRQALDDEAPDAETRRQLETLESDIRRKLDADGAPDDELPLGEQARRLEARFAADHPALEGFLRELADMLAKMGV